MRIEKRSLSEAKDLIGVLGRSSKEELERYLDEAWRPYLVVSTAKHVRIGDGFAGVCGGSTGFLSLGVP